MAEDNRDFSRPTTRLALLSNLRKDPLLIKEMARGCRDGKIQLCSYRVPKSHFATKCDELRSCDDLRQVAVNHGVLRQQHRSTTPQNKQRRRVVEHKGNV